jgi:hypothetical protein
VFLEVFAAFSGMVLQTSTEITVKLTSNTFEENTMADEPTDSNMHPPSPVGKMNTGAPEPKPEEKPEEIPRMHKDSEPKKSGLSIPPSIPEQSENYKAGYRAGYQAGYAAGKGAK